MKLKEIPRGWKTDRLDKFCVIRSGGTPSRGNASYYGGNIPWIKISDLNNGILYDSEEHITNAGLKNSSARMFPVNTVLFAMYGATIGKTAILGVPAATNQAICGLQCGNELLPQYLHYFMQSKYQEIRKKAEGAAQPNVNQNKVKSLEICLPSLEVQIKIVRRLENLMKDIYDRGNIIRAIQRKNSEMIKLIKEKLFYTTISHTIEKNEPTSWGALEEYVLPIETYNPKNNPNRSFQYIEIGSIDSENKVITSLKTIIGKTAPSRARLPVKTNDVLYAMTRPYYRNVLIISDTLDNQICSTGFCVLRIKEQDKLNPKFLFYYLLSNKATEQILKSMRGGNYPAVSRKDVIRIDIPIFSTEVQTKIVEILDNMNVQMMTVRRKLNDITITEKKLAAQLDNLSRSILNKALSNKLIF